MPHFECGTINHSATSPRGRNDGPRPVRLWACSMRGFPGRQGGVSGDFAGRGENCAGNAGERAENRYFGIDLTGLGRTESDGWLRVSGTSAPSAVMPGLVPSDLAKPSRRYIHVFLAEKLRRRGYPREARARRLRTLKHVARCVRRDALCTRDNPALLTPSCRSSSRSSRLSYPASSPPCRRPSPCPCGW